MNDYWGRGALRHLPLYLTSRIDWHWQNCPKGLLLNLCLRSGEMLSLSVCGNRPYRQRIPCERGILGLLSSVRSRSRNLNIGRLSYIPYS